MDFPSLTITRETKKKGRRRPMKTREFTVTLLGYLTADAQWELSSSEKAIRPAWIAYAGPAEACRAFTANFRAGRKAKRNHDVFEVPKSSPHRWVTHRHGEAAVTVAYVPELFHLDPVKPPDAIGFIMMPPRWWLDEQAEALRDELGSEAEEAARAALFVAYLDRRSPLPIVHDLAFHLQLYRAALEEPWTFEVETTRSLNAAGLGACGLDEPILCAVDHRRFEAFLASETTSYFEKEIAHGTHRLRPGGRILPYAAGDPLQLRLDFAVA